MSGNAGMTSAPAMSSTTSESSAKDTHAAVPRHAGRGKPLIPLSAVAKVEIVVVLIFIILYMTYSDLADAALMMLAVPEALAGGAFFMYLFPKIMNGWDAPPMDFSVAVWVGFIACFGMATSTGIIMLVYLREAVERGGGLANMTLDQLRAAVLDGAVHRLRPKLLTEATTIIGLAPMLWATGVGAEVIRPMAVPVLGGIITFKLGGNVVNAELLTRSYVMHVVMLPLGLLALLFFLLTLVPQGVGDSRGRSEDGDRSKGAPELVRDAHAATLGRSRAGVVGACPGPRSGLTLSRYPRRR